MVTSFGLDISHHQGTSLDLNKCKKEGIGFLFIKSTEGSKFVDPLFKTNLDKGRQAEMVVAAYHYLKKDVSAASQVENILKVVPKDVPVIPDVEANSGGVALVRELVDKLGKVGYGVPLLYLPRWYWQQIGSPSLAGLPPLWSSRYPDNIVGSIQDEYADVPVTYWNGYGGLSVEVLQFTSSGRVGGYQPLDVNAYRGTTEQLANILGVSDMDAEQNRKLTFLYEASLDGGPSTPDGKSWQNLWKETLDQVNTLSTAGVDLDILADRVTQRLGDSFANLVADKIYQRMKE